MDKESFVFNTWLKREEKRKVTSRIEKNRQKLALC